MLLVAAGCQATPPGKPPAKPLVFATVAPGIEHASFALEDAFSGHAFVVDLEKADVHVVPARGVIVGDSRQTVDVIAGALPVHLATNASFFDEKHVAMGRVVDGGTAMVKERRAAWGALVIEGKRARIALGDALSADKPGGDLVVQGIPRLVVGGEVPKLKPAVAERTAVCALGSKLVVVVATKADTTDFARFLALPRDKGGLGCVDALNLDGGPSTQPNALVVTPKPPAPPPLPTRP